ncbi:MAG: putative bifunctional diguanylate cyclase/phosphodiesterase [Mycobacterium leprae]
MMLKTDSASSSTPRLFVLEDLSRALVTAKNYGGLVALLLLDLDRFGLVNCCLGDAIGDELLAMVARRIDRSLEPKELVLRAGGDQFAILLPGADAAHALALADGLLKTLEGPFVVDGRELYAPAAVGIALYPATAETATELRQQAEVALYLAKRDQGARTVLFEPAMAQDLQQRFAMELDLRGALERGEFFLQYQPTVDLQSSSIIGVEALLRWRHPQRGVVAPMEFIPLAEETGLINSIGRWVLRTACNQVSQWEVENGGRRLNLNVNLSAVQLVGPHLADEVDRALTESGLSPSQLVLELTESALLHGTPRVLRTLGVLKALGVRLAVDDFGTGYASLTYLRRFPVDILKIDKSFVDAVQPGSREFALVHSIMDIALALELETCAEGIERADQLSELQGLRCHQGQGYYFARPLDPSGVEALLRQ